MERRTRAESENLGQDSGYIPSARGRNLCVQSDITPSFDAARSCTGEARWLYPSACRPNLNDPRAFMSFSIRTLIASVRTANGLPSAGSLTG